MKYVGAAFVALTGCAAAVGLLYVWLTVGPKNGDDTEMALIGAFILAGLSIFIAGVIAEVVHWDEPKKS